MRFKTYPTLSSPESVPPGVYGRQIKSSAAGELASAQRREAMGSTVSARQTTYAEPDILRVFIDWMIWAGVLPQPANGYDVGKLVPGEQIRKWPSIIEQSEDEQADTRLNGHKQRWH